MPLLLRRSAPSPSVDELAFAIPAAPLSGAGSSRSSLGSEVSYPQLQRCSTHARMSMRRRRSTAGTEGELAASCGDSDCAGSLRPSQLSLRGSTLYEVPDCHDATCEAACRDSKRLSGEGSQQEDLSDQTSSSDCGYGSEAGRVSSAPSCSCSLKDDELFITSSTVLIEDQQLAVVDMELRDFRKTFAKKLYSRLTHSFTRKKRPQSTPNLLGR